MKGRGPKCYMLSSSGPNLASTQNIVTYTLTNMFFYDVDICVVRQENHSRGMVAYLDQRLNWTTAITGIVKSVRPGRAYH